MVIMGFDFKSLKDQIINSFSSPTISPKKENVRDILLRSSSLLFERILLERETSL